SKSGVSYSAQSMQPLGRGHAVRVTLWGGLEEKLIEKRTRPVGLYPIILTSLSVKLYNNRIYLSSSSSTLIMDDDSIPILKQLKIDESGMETSKPRLSVDFSKAKAGTLENLLMWGAQQQERYMPPIFSCVPHVALSSDTAFTTLLFSQAATLNCEVQIDKVRRKKGWNYPACGGDKCKKPATRQEGYFWCESCERVVEYPVMRSRLELKVSDHRWSYPGLPTALSNIVGTTHTLELKAHTYYEHATYESFRCWKIVSAEEPRTADADASSKNKRNKSHVVDDSGMKYAVSISKSADTN
nr:hypothetical protein [Tanacetum cinerariifolium]